MKSSGDNLENTVEGQFKDSVIDKIRAETIKWFEDLNKSVLIEKAKLNNSDSVLIEEAKQNFSRSTEHTIADDTNVDAAASRILEKHIKAFEELAK